VFLIPRKTYLPSPQKLPHIASLFVVWRFSKNKKKGTIKKITEKLNHFAPSHSLVSTIFFSACALGIYASFIFDGILPTQNVNGLFGNCATQIYYMHLCSFMAWKNVKRKT